MDVRVELSSSAPHCHLVELDGWHAYADGDGLAVLSAGSYAFVHFQVGPDHRDVFQCFGAVTDQGCVAHWGCHFAVFDEICLGGGKDELAVGDVNLTATEVDGVEAALDAPNNVLGCIVAGEHVSVGHARHGDGLVAFAAAGAGVGHAHQPRGE